MCSMCDFRTSEKSHLTRHMITHSEEKPYPCSKCHLNFKTMDNLRKHEYHVHTHSEVRKWKCDYCGKAFKKSTNLKEHVRLHTGDWAATCKLCDKNFAQMCNYKLHMRRTHAMDK